MEVSKNIYVEGERGKDDTQKGEMKSLNIFLKSGKKMVIVRREGTHFLRIRELSVIHL